MLFALVSATILPQDELSKVRSLNVDSLKSEQAIKQNYMIVLNNAGLSPLTFGLTGLEAIDATAESQQEKEKVSIRTRNLKNDIQEPAISKMMSVGYDLYQIIKGMREDTEGAYVVNIEPAKVIFKFNDYIIKSKEDRVNETLTGLQSGVYDLATAIEYVHEDKTEEEQILIRINSKIEKGIPLTPEEAIIAGIPVPEPQEELPEDQFEANDNEDDEDIEDTEEE